jgi:probable F420-dependent oxidoreductase
VKVGIRFANSDWRADPEAGSEFARVAEECGFESLWAVDRLTVPWEPSAAYPYAAGGTLPDWFHEIDLPDPFVWLTFIAARTSRLVLGTGVLVLPLRSPVLVAKQAASLDRLSGGRLLLGVGSGWLREEFDAVGAGFTDRHERLSESVAAMRALWTEPRAGYTGRHACFADLDMRPRPGRPVPVHVGGSTIAAARRAGRLGDGFCPPGGRPDWLAAMVTAARSEAAAAGRDPDALEVTIGIGDPEEVTAYRRAGAHRVLLAPPGRDRATGLAGLRTLASGLGRAGVRL